MLGTAVQELLRILPIYANGLMLKKYEAIRFMVEMVHAILALRAVEVACARHVMISALPAGISYCIL